MQECAGRRGHISEPLANKGPWPFLTSANTIYSFCDSTATSICVHCEILLVVLQNSYYSEINLFTGDFNKSQFCPLTLKRKFVYNFPNRPENFTKSQQIVLILTDSVDHSDVITSDSIKLSTNLFTLLFGNDAVLINSPIVLFCPLSGSVVYTSLKNIEDSAHEKLSVFCHTGKPVIGVDYIYFTTKWEKETQDEDRKKKSDGLILTASDGKCTLVSSWNDHGVHFVPFTIPGPVACFSTHGNTIYHSDGRDFYEGEILAGVDSGNVTAYVLNQRCIGICNVQRCISIQNQVLVEGM